MNIGPFNLKLRSPIVVQKRVGKIWWCLNGDCGAYCRRRRLSDSHEGACKRCDHALRRADAEARSDSPSWTRTRAVISDYWWAPLCVVGLSCGLFSIVKLVIL